jgi:hypothetical protein
MRAVLVLAAISGCRPETRAGASSTWTIFVSTTGNDAGNGDAEHPFLTLERARDEVRAAKRAGHYPRGGVEIVLRAGNYEREHAFEIDAEDSGLPGAPIVYRAATAERVRIVGARVLSFEPVDDPRLPAIARGHVVQAALGAIDPEGIEVIVDGTALPLARWPDDGFATVTSADGPQIQYDGDRPSHWMDEPDAWVHGYWYWNWADERERIESIDPAAHTIQLAPPYHHYGYRGGQRFYAYNVLAELDHPGEWYLDRAHRRILIWPPRPGADARVSIASELVSMRGASDVVLRDLAFEAARGDAVTIDHGSRDEVAGCSIRAVGGWGVQVTGGTHVRVVGCTIAGTGLGGISLGGGDRATLTPAGHAAVGNDIHDYARWKRTYEPAIALVGVGSRAEHNHIHDAPHEAIAFEGNDHQIEGNRIEHVCTETADAGAIYGGRDWTMRGTTIANNLVRDVRGFDGHGAVGVYLDDMLSGTRVTGNTFFDVARAMFVGGGRDNTIEYNLFATCDVAVHVDARGLEWASSSIDRDLVPRLNAVPYTSVAWTARYPELGHLLDEAPAEPRGNRIAHNIEWQCGSDEIDPRAAALLRSEANVVAQ